MLIQFECTFWHFLILTLIPEGWGLIQTERYSFHREYSQPCSLLVTVIFGVSSKSSVISHTLPHVLTPVLCGMEEVSILLCLQITLLSFGSTHTQTIKPIFTWSKTDRWIVRKGLKRGRGEEMNVLLHCGFFEKGVGWLGRRVTVNGKKWTRFTGGCDRKRLFLTRRQSQSELQIHHFSEAGRKGVRGGF